MNDARFKTIDGVYSKLVVDVKGMSDKDFGFLEKEFLNEKIYKTNESCELKDVFGEEVQFDKITEFLWTFLKNGTTKKLMIKELMDYFQLEENKSIEFVNNVVELLLRQGLITCFSNEFKEKRGV